MPRPFDERAVNCDNPRAVIKLRCTVLFTLLAASGCEKSNNVPGLQEEALATARAYQGRFEELAHRAEALGRRGSSFPPDTRNTADAQRAYRHALSTIDEQSRYLRQIPVRVQAGVKSGDPEELEKLIDEQRQRLEVRLTEANAEITAVESWIGLADQAQATRRAAGAPAAAPPPPAPPTPPPPSEDSAGAASGSAAPIR